jgi:hypothetical protein
MPTLIWEGISITLSHHLQCFGGPFDHPELHAKERIPVTETGYRSHFIHLDKLALWDSPEAFVLDWLNAAARHPNWPAYRPPGSRLRDTAPDDQERSFSPWSKTQPKTSIDWAPAKGWR